MTTREELTRRRDVKAVHNLAKSHGLQSLYKGSAIVVDGVRYSYTDILQAKLKNKGLSFPAAKTRKTPDGVAFSGPHSFLSNLYPCEITDNNGRTFRSVEHRYAVECAEFHHDQLALAKLNSETNQFEIKATHDGIKKTKDWMDSRVDRLKSIVKDKFSSHPHLLIQLRQTEGFIYEATSDKFFGCCMGLHQANSITQPKITGRNCMGNFLREIRDEHL